MVPQQAPRDCADEHTSPVSGVIVGNRKLPYGVAKILTERREHR